MPTSVKACRVCGKSYEACHTMNKVAGVFRWQEVACSPECGAEYLRRITESRSSTLSASKPNKSKRRSAHVEMNENEGKSVEIPAPEPVSEPAYRPSVEAFVEAPIKNE